MHKRLQKQIEQMPYSLTQKCLVNFSKKNFSLTRLAAEQVQGGHAHEKKEMAPQKVNCKRERKRAAAAAAATTTTTTTATFIYWIDLAAPPVNYTYFRT